MKWKVQRGWRPSQPRTVELVGSVVVEDDMDGIAGRDLAFDGIQEADEFLVPVVLHVAADHRVVEDIECRGAVPLVVVGRLRACGDPTTVPRRPGFIGRLGWVRSKA